MKKLKVWTSPKKAKLMAAAMLGTAVCSTVGAMAVDTPAATITTALTTAATTMISDSMSMIAAIVPIVLPLVGAGILIAYGVKFIKRITSKA